MPELTNMPAPSLPLTGGELVPGLQGGNGVGLLTAMLAQVPRGAILLARAAYVADLSSTADADPGAGNVRWDNGVPDAASTLYVSDEDGGSNDHSALWGALGAGGRLYLQRLGVEGIESQQVWRIDSVEGASGYAKLSVTLLASHGEIADDDDVQVTIQAAALGATDAVEVNYDSSGSGLGAGNVQAAIDSLAAGVVAVDSPSNVGGTVTLDFKGRSRYAGAITLTANVSTLEFINLPGPGAYAEYELHLAQDATGGRTMTLPGTHKALGGSDTSIALAGSAVTVLTGATVDNGATWRYAMQESA